LSTTVSGKYAYADDLAIMHSDGDWQAVEGVQSKDMATRAGLRGQLPPGPPLQGDPRDDI